jgi:hypothetical protein
VLALVTFPLASASPTLMLWVFFALMAGASVVGGAGMPAWADLIGRMMPGPWRGRFYGLSSAVGGVLAVGGGAAAAALLRRFPMLQRFRPCYFNKSKTPEHRHNPKPSRKSQRKEFDGTPTNPQTWNESLSIHQYQLQFFARGRRNSIGRIARPPLVPQCGDCASQPQ